MTAVLCFHRMQFFRNLLNAISRFLTRAAKSCYDLDFYRQVRTGTFGSAVRYAFGFHLALTLVIASFFVPLAVGAKARLTDYLHKTLPENGSVTLQGGHLSTTLSVPY